MWLTKEEARQIRRGDYIPKGPSVDITTLRFRHTKSNEVYQCCKQTSRDPQSGPIYCGDIADYVAETKSGYVALCGGHPPAKNQIDD